MIWRNTYEKIGEFTYAADYTIVIVCMQRMPL